MFSKPGLVLLSAAVLLGGLGLIAALVATDGHPARGPLFAALLTAVTLAVILRMRPPMLALVLLVAFAARLAAATLTEFWSPFPAYYFSDANDFSAYAAARVHAWTVDSHASFQGLLTGGKVVYGTLLALVYYVAGPSTIVAKVVNVVVGVATVAVYARMLARVGVGSRYVIAFALLLAVWPSHVLWTSQNFRDPLVGLGVAVVLYAATSAHSFRMLIPAGVATVVIVLLRASLALPMVAFLVAHRGLMGGLRASRQTVVFGVVAAGVLVLVAGTAPLSVDDVVAQRQFAQSVGQAAGVRSSLGAGVELRSGTDLAWLAVVALPAALLRPLPGLDAVDRLGPAFAALENLVRLGLVLWLVTRPRLVMASPVGRVLTGWCALAAVVIAVGSPDQGAAVRHSATLLIPSVLALVVLTKSATDAAAAPAAAPRSPAPASGRRTPGAPSGALPRAMPGSPVATPPARPS